MWTVFIKIRWFILFVHYLDWGLIFSGTHGFYRVPLCRLRVPHGPFRRRLVPPFNTLFISPRSSFVVGFLPYCNLNFPLNSSSAAFKSRRKFIMGLFFIWLTVGNLGMRALDILNLGMRSLGYLMGSTIV